MATKISFINAMADVCDAAGGDVVTLADAIGYDTADRRRFLSAGIGFGGGCLPKDIRAFMARAGELGVDEALSFLRDVDEINMRRRQRAVDVARELAGGTFAAATSPSWARRSSRIAMTSGIRRPWPWPSPCSCRAPGSGARPCRDGQRPRVVPRAGVRAGRGEGLRACDLVLHLTEWSDYRELDPSALAKVVRQPRVLDGRNALDMQMWRAPAGLCAPSAGHTTENSRTITIY